MATRELVGTHPTEHEFHKADGIRAVPVWQWCLDG